MNRQQEFRKQTEEAKLEAFSLMCRKVAELEKENTELKKKCYKKAVKDYCELEKENAELKHTVAELRRDKDNLNTHTKAQKKLSEYRSEQLTKAKEIMKHLLDWQYDEYKKSETDKELFKVIAEAEQFLNSEEA